MLVRRLVELDKPGRVVGIDIERRVVPGVTWRLADVRDPTLATRLSGVDTVVHLAGDRSVDADPQMRRALNVHGTDRLLDAAVSAGVGRVVLLTSAAVYGARATNPVPLAEDAPVRGQPGEGLIGDWVAVEQLAQARAGDLEVTSVRPASVVGRDTPSMMGSLFEGVRLLALRDARCYWQFCHVDDLLDVLVLAARGTVTGAVTVGSEGWLSHAEVEQISGLRSIVLPLAVATATANRLYRVHAIRTPATDLDYLMHPWVVGSQQLRRTGWTPRWTNEAALRQHLAGLGERAGRGLVVMERRDATRAAAGATLALIGSLAIVARSRSGRHG
jgi:nucleoside-diphosphate-sugar epimerase